MAWENICVIKTVLLFVSTALAIFLILPISGGGVRSVQSGVRSLFLRVSPPTVEIKEFPAGATLKHGESAATMDGKFALTFNGVKRTITVTTPYNTYRDVPLGVQKLAYNEHLFDGHYAVSVGYDYGDQVQFEIYELSSSLSPGSTADRIESISPMDGDKIPLKGNISLKLNSSGSCEQRLYYLDEVRGDGAGGGTSLVVPPGTCKPYTQELPFQYDKPGKYHIFLVERISNTLKRTVEQKDVVVVGPSTSSPFVKLRPIDDESRMISPGRYPARLGSIVQVKWITRNVQDCTLTANGALILENAEEDHDSISGIDSIQQTTEFNLTCKDDQGNSVPDSITVEVIPA